MFRTSQRAATAALLAILALPAAAAAQVCIGVPVSDGAFAIEGQFSVTDGAKGYGGTLTANVAGPITAQGGYTLTKIDDVDSNINSFHARIGYELPNMSFSACPVVGAQYSKWSEEFFGIEIDLTQTVIPIGLGLGREFAAGPNLNMSLFAVPQFLYVRDKVSASDGTDSGSETETSSEFGAELGFRLGTGALFGGAGVSFTTFDESDPVFTIAIGIAFGGR